MEREIKKLLKKKSWTGVEVGRTLVNSIIHDILHQGEPDFRPLLSQSDFDKMESSLSSERDLLNYEVYTELYNAIIYASNKRQENCRDFCNGSYRYGMQLKECLAAEKTLQSTLHIPFVMTKKQYNKLKKQRETTLKGFTESFDRLFFDLLSYIMENPKDAPDAIKKAIEATKKEPVTNTHILKNYCKVCGDGYYTLPDGTRSDSFEEEEWEEKLKEEYLKTHKLFVNGKQGSFEDTVLYYNKKMKLKGYELFFNGIDAVKALYKEHTGEDLPAEEEVSIMKALELFLNIRDDILLEGKTHLLQPAVAQIKDLLDGELGCGIVWHYYEEAPEDLTKYDILKKNICFYNGEKSEEGKPQLEEFKADYPTLYKDLNTYIKKIVPPARDLKPTQYSNDFISWGELAEMGVKPFPACCKVDKVTDILEVLHEHDEDTTENYIKRERLMHNGIVIAQNPYTSKINTKGEYIDEIQFFLKKGLFIDSIDKSEPKKKSIQALIEEEILPSLQYLYAFNSIVKILGAVYDFDELKKIEKSTDLYEKNLDEINNMLYTLYEGVYGTEADKERKRKIIKSVFKPIKYEGIKPTAEAIENVTTELKKLGFTFETKEKLKNLDEIINDL